eukprot:3208232-Pyramimonas_sp.AAC.1
MEHCQPLQHAGMHMCHRHCQSCHMRSAMGFICPEDRENARIDIGSQLLRTTTPMPFAAYTIGASAIIELPEAAHGSRQ